MPDALTLFAAEGHWAIDSLKILAIPALVLLNGFFVAAEFALVAVRRTQVEEMIRQGRRGAHAVRRQVEHLDRSIAASQLGITIASLILGWVGEPAVALLCAPLFAFLPDAWEATAAHSTAIIIVSLFVITFLHAVLGEQVPKVMALQKPVAVALWIALPLEAFTLMTRPVVLFMNTTGNWIVRLLGFRVEPGEHLVHSVEELGMLIEEVEEAGLLSPDQAEFVHNVFELAQKTVGDCMVPREKIAALELHTSPDKVLEAVRQGAHTRMPVYEGELDNILGIVNTKDLFYLFSLQGVVVLQDAIYPTLSLKQDQPIGDALLLFRKAKRPMAIVRSEDGKIAGMITLEDVLEQIVGDIEDEHDRPVRKVRLRPARLRTLPRPPAKPK